jgi:hypothetical protein
LTTKSLRTALPIGEEIDAVGVLDAGDEEFEPQTIPAAPAVVAVRGDRQGCWHPQWAETPVESRIRLGEREYRVGPNTPFVHDTLLGTVSSAEVWAGSSESGAWIGIPVIDPAGGFCRQPFKPMPFDELLLSLLDWKTLGELADESTDPDDDGPGGTPRPMVPAGAEGRDQFPIARAAMLVEQIAQVHDSLALHELPAWLRRLEALLTEALDAALLHAWRSLEIDFLAHFTEPMFRPACLGDPQDAQTRAMLDEYLALLTRVQSSWQFSQES